MTAPEYRKQISLGNVIQIVLMLIGGAVAFSTLEARETRNSERIDSIHAENLDVELRLRSLESSYARADERFSSIMSMLAKIEAAIDRLDRGMP